MMNSEDITFKKILFIIYQPYKLGSRVLGKRPRMGVIGAKTIFSTVRKVSKNK